MSYLAIAEMARDQDLQDRIHAAVALEGIAWPEAWLSQRRWQIVARTDWAESWAYATALGKPSPGRDESVITDQMILSSVQLAGGRP